MKRTLKESLAAETVEFAASDSKVMLSMKFASHFPSTHDPLQYVYPSIPNIAEQSLSVVQVVGQPLLAWTDLAVVKKSTKARIQTAGAPKNLVNMVNYLWYESCLYVMNNIYLLFVAYGVKF